jgi:hypothetical protein
MGASSHLIAVGRKEGSRRAIHMTLHLKCTVSY